MMVPRCGHETIAYTGGKAGTAYLSGCTLCGMSASSAERSMDRAAVPEGTTIRCEDCKAHCNALNAFAVIPPPTRFEGGGRSCWLCVKCWDRMVGAAVMEAIR